jgi:UDP-N-acetylglucosamine 2-epimerase (non-hydrolysing)
MATVGGPDRTWRHQRYPDISGDSHQPQDGKLGTSRNHKASPPFVALTLVPDVHIVGARPNFMKAAPVVDALSRLGRRPLLVHTGQHYDHEMSEIFFRQLGLPRPDANLEVGSGSHAGQTAALLISLEEYLLEHNPPRVVVYGDINSTLAAAVVATKLGIDVAHVEAGLRSFDRSMPEEINRLVTDVLSSVHFVTSPEAVDQLAAEGISGDGVHFVGNPMIDTLLRFRDALDIEGARRAHGLEGRYAVATLHRPSNVDDHETARKVVIGLAHVAKLLPLVFPLHPRGRETLTAAGLMEVPNVAVVDPLGYLDFMALMAGAALVLTDSGGIQEETTVLGIPCLTLRDNTERPITLSMGTNVLVGNDSHRIAEAAEKALSDPPTGRIPPLWDGSAGRRIADILFVGNGSAARTAL